MTFSQTLLKLKTSGQVLDTCLVPGTEPEKKRASGTFSISQGPGPNEPTLKKFLLGSELRSLLLTHKENHTHIFQKSTAGMSTFLAILILQQDDIFALLNLLTLHSFLHQHTKTSIIAEYEMCLASSSRPQRSLTTGNGRVSRCRRAASKGVHSPHKTQIHISSLGLLVSLCFFCPPHGALSSLSLQEPASMTTMRSNMWSLKELRCS